jgi:hypothetical protein
MIESGQVKGGATDTHPDGAWSPLTGNIHFDPTYLDSAVAGGVPLWDIANTALHEAMHALGKDHGEPLPSPWGPLYSEAPFSYLSPGENSCILYS